MNNINTFSLFGADLDELCIEQSNPVSSTTVDNFDDFEVPEFSINEADVTLASISNSENILEHVGNRLGCLKQLLVDAHAVNQMTPAFAASIHRCYMATTEEVSSLRKDLEVPALEADDVNGIEAYEVALENAFTDTMGKIYETIKSFILRMYNAVKDAIKGLFDKQLRIQKAIDKAEAIAANVTGEPVNDTIKTKGFANLFLSSDKMGDVSPKFINQVSTQGLPAITKEIEAAAKALQTPDMSDANKGLSYAMGKVSAALVKVFGSTKKIPSNNKLGGAIKDSDKEVYASLKVSDPLPGGVVVVVKAPKDNSGKAPAALFVNAKAAPAPETIPAPTALDAAKSISLAKSLAAEFSGYQKNSQLLVESTKSLVAALSKSAARDDASATKEVKDLYAQYVRACKDLASLSKTVVLPFGNWITEQTRAELAYAVAGFKNISDKPAKDDNK